MNQDIESEIERLFGLNTIGSLRARSFAMFLAERWANKCKAPTSDIPHMQLIGKGYASLISDDMK